MVDGGILTVHPGSIHGGGEALEGGSSLRKGAEKRSSGAPDLGSAAAAEQRRDREKGFRPRGFLVTGNNRRNGAARGGPGAPGAPLARPGVGPCPLAAWGPPASPLAPLGLFSKL